MAPPPENDNTPKAPDKNDKTKGDKHGNSDINKEKNKDFKTLNNLNDCELKDLLDEAITYKNPKDREGKSSLFKELLSQAEESERNARAASAGGSEQVRYCNTSAKRSKHRRKPNSISEHVMHGGSLDNLAKEELFEVSHHLNRPKRTVSARQREGGSLPSNVNAGSLASYDPHFLEEARRKRTVGGGDSPEPMDVDMETASLLEHDAVAENFDGGGTTTLELVENVPQQSVPRFTSRATLQIGKYDVDDALHISELDPVEKKPYELEQISAKVVQSKYSVYIQNYSPLNETSKKVDENGNALHQNTTSKGKKKKIQADKNVVSCVAAEKVEGHRSDIINDVDKLVQYIGENDKGGAQNKANAHRSNKQLHKHTEEGARSGGSKKQRAQSSKGKENRSELKKSNSLGEISTTKLDNFNFDDNSREETEQDESEEVVLRTKQDSAIEKPRERRSWGNAEHPVMTNFYKNPSTENLESASSSDFRVVMKKKKTKKRRSSVSGSRRKMSNVNSNCANSSKSDGDRASSPVPRRKSACSVPHSEKSNDSSDVDSVHSLPIDTSQRMDSSLNSEDAPISYADIARNSERKLCYDLTKKITSESARITSSRDLAVSTFVNSNDVATPKVQAQPLLGHVSETPSLPCGNEAIVKTMAHAQSQTTPPKALPPDVHNIKSFPSIHSANNKINKGGEKTNGGRGINNKSQQGKQLQQNMVQCNNVANVNRSSRNQLNNVALGGGEQNDIQNNLSIIQANEIDSIQYNSQIIPTMHIPDVQTIEKIHFMNQPGGHMPAHLQQHVVPPQHLHMALPHPHHHHSLPLLPLTEMFTNGRPPAAYTAIISHTPHQPTHGGVAYVKAAQAYEGVGVAYIDHTYLPPKGALKDAVVNPHVVVPVIDNQNVRNSNLVTVTTQTNSDAKHISNILNSGSNNNVNKSVDNENSDSASNKQNKSKYKKSSQGGNNNPGVDRNRNNSVPTSSSPSSSNVAAKASSHTSPALSAVIAHSDSSSTDGANRQTVGSAPRRTQEAESSPSSSSVQDDSSAASNCDTRTNISDCASSEDSSSSDNNSNNGGRPAVVILSGLSNKEVSGLVFGFDVNEELLCEDICENFVQRFVTPEIYSSTSHNHDKIVNYIGSAWEDIRKHHSLGKAQYYSDNL